MIKFLIKKLIKLIIFCSQVCGLFLFFVNPHNLISVKAENKVKSGGEKIVLTGLINGVSVPELYSDYQLHFDSKKSQYSIITNLSEGDFFTFYMERKNTFINYLENNEYAEEKYRSAGIRMHYSIGRPHIHIKITGTYEFILSSKIEDMDDPTQIWAEADDSYIRFLGTNVVDSFVLVNNINYDSINVLTSGKHPEIFQYGKYGSDCSAIKGIVTDINGVHAKILKITFDEEYSDEMDIKLTFGDETTAITGPLKGKIVYGLDKNEHFLISSCSFIDKMISIIGTTDNNGEYYLTIKTLNESTLDYLIKEYKKLDESNQNFFNGSTFLIQNDNSFESVSGRDLFSVIQNSMQKAPVGSYKLAVLIFCFVVVSSVFVVAYASKCKKGLMKKDE